MKDLLQLRYVTSSYEGPDLVASIEDEAEIDTLRSLIVFSHKHLDLESSASPSPPFSISTCCQDHTSRISETEYPGSRINDQRPTMQNRAKLQISNTTR